MKQACIGLLFFALLLSIPTVVYARQNVTKEIQAGEFDSSLTNFISKSNGVITLIDDQTIKISDTGGDHFALYNGTQKLYKSFLYEADIKLTSGFSAALLIGIQDLANPGSRWLGVNFNKNETVNAIRVFDAGSGRGDLVKSVKPDYINFDDTLHLSIDVSNNGDFTYTIGNKDGLTKSLQGNISNWKGGFIGLLTFRSEALFSHVKFTDRTNYSGTYIDNTSGKLNTNIKDLFYSDGTWSVIDGGLKNVSAGDEFLFSTTKVKDFVYSADVTFGNRNNSAASLLIRGTNDLVTKNMYIANVNAQTGVARLFKFQNNSALDLVSSKVVPLTADNKYHLEVTAIGKHMVFKVNGELVVNTADYTSATVYGQNDAIMEGYVGLLSWNANVMYQNMILTEITDATNPQLNQLSVLAVDGAVEHQLFFKPDQYVYIAYVSNATTKVNLDYGKLNATTTATITNSDKLELTNDLPVKLGLNTYTITTKEGDATLVYRVIVIRRNDPETYYNEQYRDQFHFSVKQGWSNDPNGMVFYNGEYHLFYQFYTDVNWGPMHWAHSVSKDLIHWEELPIALYPDEYGTMFSGSAVVDDTNTSGLFLENDGSKSAQGGMVSIITADGNGERVTIAYSKDGRNWNKVEGVVKDWTEDPLNDAAFRDPKVFRFENKWFMVIAGGPVRIYSSDNLIDWTVESTYSGLDTECPDLYRLPVMEGSQIAGYKWVLSRGGRYYKVGDFKQVGDKYQFVMDSQYSGTGTQNDGIQNFGPDAYAAQTYSLGKFDDYQRVIQTNWMRPYKSDIDGLKQNLTFNGNFNMQLELTLIKDNNGKYFMQQTPIKEYESIRNTGSKVSLSNKIINNEKQKLDFRGESYEIIAEFTPEAGVTEVGFNVRVGAENFTKVGYNLTEDKFFMDRSKSGLGTNSFFQSFSQKAILAHDGKVQLHIFVDRSSVEMFANNYTITGATQIFPTAGCDSLEIFAVGGTASANIEIYPLNTIWVDKAVVTKPTEVLVPSTVLSKSVNDVFSIKASVYPNEVSQSVVWQMADNDVVTMQADGNTATFTAKKAGSVKVEVHSAADNNIFKEITLTIRENNFVTNLDWTQIPTNWYFDNTLFTSQASDNSFAFADNRVSDQTYTYTADVQNTSGIVNLIFGSQTTNAYEGCYAVQLIYGSNQVRLFDFKNDYTFTSLTSPAVRTSGKNHVVVEVHGTVISVLINTITVIYKDIASTGRIYSNGLFGLGICAGSTSFFNVIFKQGATSATGTTILPSDTKIQYMGRIDFTDPDKPLFAYPNVTIKAKFEGTSLDLLLKHYNGSDFADNYFISIIDGKTPFKFKVTSALEKYPIAKGLIDTIHTVEIVKVTESYCGECQFLGFELDSSKTLQMSDPLPELKLEFLGNSITSGFGIEGGAQPASDNSYKSYAAVAARELNAQFHTTSYSGIGVVKGWPNFLMKDMYGRLIANTTYIPFPINNVWNTSRFIPDVVVIALGTNDYNLGLGNGTITSATFNTGYNSLVSMIRTAYPNAQIVCTNSPMVANTLLGDNIQTDVAGFNTAGDSKVHYFAFTPMKGGGFGGHPGIIDGQINGKELATFIHSMLESTAIGDVAKSEMGMTLYPNPAQNSINVKSTATSSTIELSDLSGKALKTYRVSLPGEVQLDISQLNKGIYFCTIITDKKIRFVQKICKL